MGRVGQQMEKVLHKCCAVFGRFRSTQGSLGVTFRGDVSATCGWLHAPAISGLSWAACIATGASDCDAGRDSVVALVARRARRRCEQHPASSADAALLGASARRRSPEARRGRGRDRHSSDAGPAKRSACRQHRLAPPPPSMPCRGAWSCGHGAHTRRGRLHSAPQSTFGVLTPGQNPGLSPTGRATGGPKANVLRVHRAKLCVSSKRSFGDEPQSRCVSRRESGP